MTYRGSYRRSSPKPARWMQLKYAGTCAVGGERLEVGARAFYDPGDRSVTCADLDHAEAAGLTAEVWTGAPTSGQWSRTLSDRRIGAAPAVYPRFDRRGGRGRCEDAPCCGCCD